MQAFLRLLTPVALATVAALATASPARAQTASPVGRWDAVVTVTNNTIDIPFTFEIVAAGSGIRGHFFDGDVTVPSNVGTFANGALDLRFDQYGARLLATLTNGRLEGKYDRGTRGAPYPFRAVRAVAPRPVSGVPSISGEWRIPVKNSRNEAAWRFIVRQNGASVSASILRIDGDTGTLSGRYADGVFLISHFSGARPVKYEVRARPDGTLSLVQNGREQLTAVRLSDPRARDMGAPTSPTQFTRMKNPSEPLRFSFKDLDGRVVSNTDSRFAGKVVMVNITGSWCPNCHDEAPFLMQLYRTYKTKGLEIVGLAFEEADQLKDPVRPRAFVKQFGIEFPMLLAGEPEEAPAKLPQAENLNAFPTTFVVGRDGRVRSVHAGFASVATGEVHAESKAAMTAEIERLLAERAP